MHVCILPAQYPCGFIAATRGAWALGACAMRDEHVTVTLEQMRRRSTTQYQTPTTTCWWLQHTVRARYLPIAACT